MKNLCTLYITGNHPTGEDIVTNGEFQASPEVNGEFQESLEGRQNRGQHCCCIRASSQCPNDRSGGFNGGGSSGGAFGGQPRLKDENDGLFVREDGEDYDDGIAVRIVNDVSILLPLKSNTFFFNIHAKHLRTLIKANV